MVLHCQNNECFKNMLIQSLSNSLPWVLKNVHLWVLEGRKLPVPSLELGF